eukprot:jgi/Undpi1/1373/HiC_scaffold_11.g04765.m1
MSTYGDSRFMGFEPFPSFTREMSMTAGLLCLFGMINLVPGVYDLVLATTDGQDWSGGEDVYPPVVLLLSALIQVAFSLISMAVGFQWLVSGGGCAKTTSMSAMFSLLSFFTFAVTISYISFQAAKENFAFIPNVFSPSTSENRSVASLFAIGYIAYAANNFVALVHLNFKMCKFQSEKWTGFNRAYYQKMLAFFGFLTLLAGTVQLALGAYIYDKVDTERLDVHIEGDEISGPYRITYSEVAMTFAVFQVILGFFILARAMQKPADNGAEDAKGLKAFQTYAWFVLIFSICAQVLTQLSMEHDLIGNTTRHGFAAQAVAYVVGLGLFPIYVDTMYYTTPETVEQGHFNCNAPWKAGKVIDEERKVEGEQPAVAAGVTAADAATAVKAAPVETDVKAGETAV